MGLYKQEDWARMDSSSDFTGVTDTSILKVNVWSLYSGYSFKIWEQYPDLDLVLDLVTLMLVMLGLGGVFWLPCVDLCVTLMILKELRQSFLYMSQP